MRGRREGKNGSCHEILVFFSRLLSSREGEESKSCALKVPKREIFDCSDFPDFYTIKSSWVGDLLVKILTYYFNF